MMLNKLWSCGSNVYMYKKSSLPSLVFHAFGIISAIHVLHEILSNGVNLWAKISKSTQMGRYNQS